MAEQRAVFAHKARCSHSAVFCIEFNSDAVSSGFQCCNHCCCGSAEWIHDGIADEGEHLDQPQSKFERVWRRMLFGRGSCEIPELLKPLIEFFFWYRAQLPLLFGRLAVPARLALHEDVFDVVFYNGVWLVRFSQELRAV